VPLAAPQTDPVRFRFEPADDVRMTDNTYPSSGQVSHITSPRDTFLTAAEVAARYRWGRTKMSQMRVSPGFPTPLHRLLSPRHPSCVGRPMLGDGVEPSPVGPSRTVRSRVAPTQVVPAPRAATSGDAPAAACQQAARPPARSPGGRAVSAPLLVGKPRAHGGGQRSWRAKLYAPDDDTRQWVVKFKWNEKGQWSGRLEMRMTSRKQRRSSPRRRSTSTAPATLPLRAADAAKRTVAALGDVYIDDSRSRGRAVRTIEGRESRLRRHICPTIGDVPVPEWRLAHFRAVIDRARETIHSAAGSPGRALDAVGHAETGVAARLAPSLDRSARRARTAPSKQSARLTEIHSASQTTPASPGRRDDTCC
jgi:hypothetical protein